jgi:hypothetical protein
MKIKIDISKAENGLRTVAALLIGNAGIAYLVDFEPKPGWWKLALPGVILLVITSIKEKKP